MTFSALMSTYIANGTHAARPSSPNVASGVSPLYYETDTGNLYVWTGSAWSLVNSSGGSGALVELADSVVSGSTTTTISFTSISGAYTTLMIQLTARADEATTADNMKVQFNGDTGSNYDGQYVEVISGQAITRNMNTTNMQIGEVMCASAPANSAWVGTLWIPNYTDTTFWKGIQSQGGGDYVSNSIDESTGGSGQWKSTAAVTRIDLIAPASSHWVAGTHARLFGIN